MSWMKRIATSWMTLVVGVGVLSLGCSRSASISDNDDRGEIYAIERGDTGNVVHYKVEGDKNDVDVESEDDGRGIEFEGR